MRSLVYFSVETTNPTVAKIMVKFLQARQRHHTFVLNTLSTLECKWFISALIHRCCWRVSHKKGLGTKIQGYESRMKTD